LIIMESGHGAGHHRITFILEVLDRVLFDLAALNENKKSQNGNFLLHFAYKAIKSILSETFIRVEN